MRTRAQWRGSNRGKEWIDDRLCNSSVQRSEEPAWPRGLRNNHNFGWTCGIGVGSEIALYDLFDQFVIGQAGEVNDYYGYLLQRGL